MALYKYAIIIIIIIVVQIMLPAWGLTCISMARQEVSNEFY